MKLRISSDYFLPLMAGAIVVVTALFPGWSFDPFFAVNRSGLFRLSVLFFGFFIVLRGRIVWRRGQSFLFLLVGCLSMLFVLATLFSSDPIVSLVGTVSRGQGLLTEVSYLLWFVLLLCSLQKEHLSLLLAIIAAGFSAVLFLALGELLGAYVFSLWEVSDIGLTATLGHPAVLGGFIVTLLPLLPVLFLASGPMRLPIFFQRWRRVIMSVVFFLAVMILFFTQTRGAWLAFLVSGLFFGGLVFYFSSRPLWFESSFFLLGILAMSGLLLVVGGGYYISNIFEAGSGTGLLRLTWWEQGWSLIQRNWLFGYGFESAQALLFQAWHPLEALAESINAHPDRFHNHFIDMAVATGVPSVTLYSSLIIYALYRARRCLSRSSDRDHRLLIIGLISSLVAFMVQAAFIFSGTVSSVLFWTVLALIFISVDEGRVVDFSRRVRLGGLVGTVGLFFLAVAYQILAPVMAHWHWQQLELAAEQKPTVWWSAYEEHRSFLETWSSWQPGQRPMRLALADRLITGYPSEARRQIDLFLQNSPATPESLALEIRFTVADPDQDKKKEIVRSISDRAEQLSPAWYGSHLDQAKALFALGSDQEALEELRRAYVLLPRLDAVDAVEFPWIRADFLAREAEVMEQFGFLYSTLGDTSRAEIFFQKQLLWSQTDLWVPYQHLSVLWQTADPAKALNYNARALVFAPDRVDLWEQRVKLFLQQGDNLQAKAAARQLFRLDPKNFFVQWLANSPE